MKKLMNVENEWSYSIDASEVEIVVRRIEAKEVACAINEMKIKKASRSYGVDLEIFKAVGDKCLKYLTNIFNDVLFKEKSLEERVLSSLVPIFRVKGNSLNPNSYSGIKSLEHTLDFILQTTKILERRLGQVVHIDKMQYGFMPERATVDFVFVLRRFT